MKKLITYNLGPNTLEYLKPFIESLRDQGILLEQSELDALSKEKEQSVCLVQVNQGQDFKDVINSLKNIKGQLIVFSNLSQLSKADFELFNDFIDQLPDSACIVDLSRPFKYYRGLLEGTLTAFTDDDSERAQLLEMARNINSLVESTFAEFQKIKSLHQKLVPMRKDTFKGVQIYSKFAAGRSSGGDFFDVVDSDSNLNIILTSSPSYLVSSVILTHVEDLKREKTINFANYSDFIKQIEADLTDMELIDNKNKSLDFFIGQLCLKTMTLKGYMFGEIELISSKGSMSETNQYPFNSAFLEKTKFERQLERDEKLVLCSPGVRKNCEGKIDGKTMGKYIQNTLNLAPREFIDHLFYQLKKDHKDEFLDHDASVFFIEVDSNVIMQV